MNLLDLFRIPKVTEERKRELEAIVARAKGLSLDVAKAEADAGLRDPARFRLRPLVSPLPEWIQGPNREFFETYGDIQGLRSETELGPDSFGRSDWYRTLNRVGQDFDLTEIVLAPESDRVCRVDGAAQIEDVLAGDAYPTLYHYIAELNAILSRWP